MQQDWRKVSLLHSRTKPWRPIAGPLPAAAICFSMIFPSHSILPRFLTSAANGAAPLLSIRSLLLFSRSSLIGFSAQPPAWARADDTGFRSCHCEAALSPPSPYDQLDLLNATGSLVQSSRHHEARTLFDRMPAHSSSSRISLGYISGYVAGNDPDEALRVFCRVLAESPPAAANMVSVALKACGMCTPFQVRAQAGRPIHAFTIKCGIGSSFFIASALVAMYSKADAPQSALQVFSEVHPSSRNVVIWTAAITALARVGRSMEAVNCFADMTAARVQCDPHSLAITLKALADLGGSQLSSGKQVHALAVKDGFYRLPYVANSLCAMYGKCGDQDAALAVFFRMSDPDVVSWTTAIASLAQTPGREEQALHLFVQMQRDAAGEDVRPNACTLSAAMSACAALSRADCGEQLHGFATKVCDITSSSAAEVANATIKMYARSGHTDLAKAVFLDMEAKDAVSWTTIISANVQLGMAEDALELFVEMRRASSVDMNGHVIASLLSVCAHMTMLNQGKQLHGSIVSAGLELDPMVGSSLISLYSKCGFVPEARAVFECQHQNGNDNVVSWTSMITGYAENGHSVEAISLFERMMDAAVVPDSVAFVGVLNACTHAGLLDHGIHYFHLMTRWYDLRPGKEHYGCLFDLLCRAGRLSEAEQLMKTMPFMPDDVMLSVFLQACRIHNRDPDHGKRAIDGMFESPHASNTDSAAGCLVALCNVYASQGRWSDMMELRLRMRSQGLRKEKGSSWITIGSHRSPQQ